MMTFLLRIRALDNSIGRATWKVSKFDILKYDIHENYDSVKKMVTLEMGFYFHFLGRMDD